MNPRLVKSRRRLPEFVSRAALVDLDMTHVAADRLGILPFAVLELVILPRFTRPRKRLPTFLSRDMALLDSDVPHVAADGLIISGFCALEFRAQNCQRRIVSADVLDFALWNFEIDESHAQFERKLDAALFNAFVRGRVAISICVLDRLISLLSDLSWEDALAC